MFILPRLRYSQVDIKMLKTFVFMLLERSWTQVDIKILLEINFWLSGFVKIVFSIFIYLLYFWTCLTQFRSFSLFSSLHMKLYRCSHELQIPWFRFTNVSHYCFPHYLLYQSMIPVIRFSSILDTSLFQFAVLFSNLFEELYLQCLVSLFLFLCRFLHSLWYRILEKAKLLYEQT